MAGFLVFHSATSAARAAGRDPAGGRAAGAGHATGAFDRVRDRIASSRGLRVLSEGGGAARVAKFARLDGSGAPAAFSPSGWVASAGLWDHDDAPAANDSAWLLDRLTSAGEGALDGLDGLYAVAWFHAPSDRLTVAADHLGRLHLYAGESAEGAWVSTFATAVAGGIGAGPDPLGMFELLTTGTIYEERSPFAGVRRVPAATRRIFAAGRSAGTSRGPTVLPPDPPASPVVPRDIADACSRRIVRLLRPYARPCADLTGGRDSRLVVGLMRRAGLRFDVTVSGPDDHPDVVASKALSRRLGLTSHQGAHPSAQMAFDALLRAAALVDGVGDPGDMMGFAERRGAERALSDVGISGAGGEVYRESWWKAKDIGSGATAVERALRRFTRSRAAIQVPFLGEPLRGDVARHFTGVIERSIRHRVRDPLPAQLDHLYLDLRAQCWQGTNATAANLAHPRLYPLLMRAPLRLVLSLDARDKVHDRLFHALFGMLGPPISTQPLASGFPPLRFGPATAWRFLACLPAWARLRAAKALRRRSRGGESEESWPLVKRLFADGAADYLDAGRLALRPLLEAAPLTEFLRTAAATGRVSPLLVRRLLAAETALREAAAMRAD